MKEVTEVDRIKLIMLQGSSGKRDIDEEQLQQYTRFKTKYPFPSIVNKQTDLNVWKAKLHNTRPGGKVKSRLQKHTTAITESCPDHFDAPVLCVYLRKVMFSKLQFDLHHDLDFQVTEKMFTQLWLERLKDNKEYGKTLRHSVTALASARGLFCQTPFLVKYSSSF